MDMHAVAHQLWIRHGREYHTMSQPMRGGSGDFTRDHRLIRGGESRGGRNCDLELARSILGQE